VMDHLAGRRQIKGMPKWNSKKMCGTLCLQHTVNKVLDAHKKGKKIKFQYGDIQHKQFV
jgi:hypothetical protein